MNHQLRFLGILLLLCTAEVVCAQGTQKMETYEQSFQGMAVPADWGFFGQGAEGFAKFDEAGLRFVIPAGFDGKRPAIGLASRVALKGNFEITLDYDILAEPDAVDAGNDGTRITLDVVLDTPGRDLATLSRRAVASPAEREFFAWRMSRTPEDKISQRGKAFPAKTKTGKLRLTRTADTVVYAVAEGDAKEFRPLIAYPFSDAVTAEIRLVAQTGTLKAALDVRVTNLVVRAAAIVKAPTAPTPPKAVAFVLPPPAAKAYAQQYMQSLKGTAKPAGWEVEGPSAEECVHFEATGLRITLPAGSPGERRGTGVKSEFGVQGDFEITASFEILAEPKQADAGKFGTRISIAAYKNTQKVNVTTVNRSVSTRAGTAFVAWASVWSDSGDKPQTPLANFSTSVRIGRLRLTREGPHLYYGLGEGRDGEIKYRAKFLFGAEDLRDVRIVGSTGGEEAAIDVRVSDLQIRADNILNAPANVARAPASDAANPAPAVPTPMPTGKGWLAAVLMVGLALTLLLAGGGGAWLLLRQHHTLASKPAPTSISFACAECRARLKAKLEFAGRKIKCSACGKPTLVPIPA